MSSFTQPIRSETTDNPLKRRLIEPFSFYLGTDENNKLCEITVPAGFESDGASIPRIFWSVASPWTGRYVKAAWLHDYLYKTGLVSKLVADVIFLEAMLICDTSYVKAHGMYLAVKFGGHAAWNACRTIETNTEY